jgi:hypothetical protein
MAHVSGSPAGPLLVLVIWLVSVIWVYQDAQSRSRRGHPVTVALGSLELTTPSAWMAGCLVLWIVFFPMYLRARQP